MGDPAEPTPADRATLRGLAARIVENVENDEEILAGVPEEYVADGSDGLTRLVFDLAHEIVLIRAELAGLRATMVVP